MSLLVVLLCGTVHAQTSSGVPAGLSKDDLAQGKVLFNSHCAICHSIGGTGGRGPVLTVPNFRHAPDNATLTKIIDTGIPGTEMPGVWAINDHETQQLVGYVRSLGRTEPVELPGKPERGKAIYEAGNCANCHIVSGKGTGIGPELTMIGLSRSVEYLRNSLTRPEADLPIGFAVIQVTLADGSIIEGVRINEDSFTIQIRDLNGRLHSLRKGELKQFRKQLRRSLMPRYTPASTDELDYLIAYMASLRKEDQ